MARRPWPCASCQNVAQQQCRQDHKCDGYNIGPKQRVRRPLARLEVRHHHTDLLSVTPFAECVGPMRNPLLAGPDVHRFSALPVMPPNIFRSQQARVVEIYAQINIYKDRMRRLPRVSTRPNVTCPFLVQKRGLPFRACGNGPVSTSSGLRPYSRHAACSS